MGYYLDLINTIIIFFFKILLVKIWGSFFYLEP